MKYKVSIATPNGSRIDECFEDYKEASGFESGAKWALTFANNTEIRVTLSETIPKPEGCSCPIKKNDGSPFDGVSYYCPLHGR